MAVSSRLNTQYTYTLGSCISYIYFQIKMDILFVEPSEQINVDEGSLEVKEELEENLLAG